MSSRFIGPFEVLKGVGSVAFKIDLLSSMCIIHLVFHVSILKSIIEMVITLFVGTLSCLIIRVILQSGTNCYIEQRREKVEDQCYSLLKGSIEKQSYWKSNIGNRGGHTRLIFIFVYWLVYFPLLRYVILG